MNRQSAILLLGLGLISLGQYNLLVYYANLPAGLVPIAVGMVAVAIAAWSAELPGGPRESPPTRGAPAPGEESRGALARHGWCPASPNRHRWRRLSALGFAVLLAAVLGLRTNSQPFQPRYAEYFSLWLASMVCFAVGTLAPGEIWARWRAIRGAVATEKRNLILVCGLTIIALFVRLVALETIPSSFSTDEGSFAIQGAMVAEGGAAYNPFAPGWLWHPYLFSFLMAPPIAFLGRSLAAARLPSAIMGGLTIPVVYLLGRELYGRRAGLVAAAFLAGFSFHLQFSRVALNNIADPLLGTLSFVFLLRGMRGGRVSDFCLAGLTLGLSQFFYTGARLLPFLMVAAVLGMAVLDPKSLGERRFDKAARLAALAAGFIIATWPENWYLLVSGESATGRIDQTGLVQTGAFNMMSLRYGTPQTLWLQLKHSWLGLIHTRDTGPFYGTKVPLMGYTAGVPFLVGVALAAVHGLRAGWRRHDTRRRPESWLPLLWIAATLTAGGALLIAPPSYSRYVLVTPAAAVLLGLGITGTLDLLEQPRGQEDPPVHRLPHDLIPLALALLLMGSEIFFYFAVYAPSSYGYARDPASMQMQEIARCVQRAHDANPAVRVFYITRYLRFEGSGLIDYLAPGVQDREVTDALDPLPGDIDPAADNLFIILWDRSPERETIQHALPGGTLTRHQDPFGTDLFWSYRRGPP